LKSAKVYLHEQRHMYRNLYTFSYGIKNTQSRNEFNGLKGSILSILQHSIVHRAEKTD